MDVFSEGTEPFPPPAAADDAATPCKASSVAPVADYVVSISPNDLKLVRQRSDGSLDQRPAPLMIGLADQSNNALLRKNEP